MTLRIRGSSDDPGAVGWGREVQVRLKRAAAILAGLDLEQTGAPQLPLGPTVIPSLQLARLDEAPFRRYGRAFHVNANLAAAVGTFSAVGFHTPPHVTGSPTVGGWLAVVDWVEYLCGTALEWGTWARLTNGDNSAPAAALNVVSPEEQLTVRETAALISSPAEFQHGPIWGYASNVLAAALDATQRDVWDVTPIAAGLVRRTFGDLVLGPGTGLVLQSLVANTALYVAFHGRIFPYPVVAALYE